MEGTAEQNEVAATYEEADQDFASCPREEHDQKDLNPPYELLREALGSETDRTNQELEPGASTAASAADREVEPERLANLRIQADDGDQSSRRQQQVSSPGSRVADGRSATGAEDVAGQLQQLVSVVGVLARRLARVEAASASDTSSGSQWRPRSDTVNLGYVDHICYVIDKYINGKVY